jgi:hypothetical protein
MVIVSFQKMSFIFNQQHSMTTKREASPDTHHGGTLGLRLLEFRMKRKQYLLFKPTLSMVFCFGGLN